MAEVNNTFAERRIYLFQASARGNLFKQVLSKDFHVSPFSSRRGSYVLKVTDPAASNDINITVTLESSKGHAKLVAQWWSSDVAVNPQQLSLMQSGHLLMGWGWAILMTCMNSVNHLLPSQGHNVSRKNTDRGLQIPELRLRLYGSRRFTNFICGIDQSLVNLPSRVSQRNLRNL